MGRNKRKSQDAAPEPVPWHRRPETLIFLAALAVRFLHLWIFRGDFWLKTALLDDQMFQSSAHAILREGWIAKSLGIFDLNPAYPYFLVIMGKTLGMGYGVVFSLQHLAGALVPVGFYLLGRRAFGRKSGLAAAALGVFFGPAIFYESRFLGEFWIYFFNLASLLALVYAHERERPQPFWFLGGLALGFSTVFRPNVLVFVPLVCVWGVFSLRENRKNLASCAALYLLALWLPLLPFQLRNRAVDPARGWGLTTSSGGINLYLGNNPEADGLNQAPSFVRYGPGHQFADFKIEAERRTGRTFGPRELSRYWVGQSLRWWTTRPGAAVKLFIRKAAFFWNHSEPPDNFFPAIFRRFTKLGPVPLIAWGLAAPLGLAGLFWSLRRPGPRKYWILHLYVLAYFGVNVLFYILSRYRFPAAAGLIPFAGYALVRLYEDYNAKARGRLAALAVLCLAALGLARLPLIGEEDMGVSHYSMAVIYANKGWKDEAAEQYRKSIAADPRFAPSYLNLGILEAERGNREAAVSALQGAWRLERDPAQAERLRANIRALGGG